MKFRSTVPVLRNTSYLSVLTLTLCLVNNLFSVDYTKDHGFEIENFYSVGLNVNSWENRIIVDHLNKTGSSISVNTGSVLRMHHVNGFRRQWKFDQKALITAKVPFRRKINGLLSGRLDRFYDQRARRYEDDVRLVPFLPSGSSPSYNLPSSTDIFKWHLGLGAEYMTKPDNYAIVTIGPDFEARNDRKQSGIRGDVEYNATRQNSSLSLVGWHSKLTTGNDYNWHVNMEGITDISESSKDKYRIKYSIGRQREYYTPNNFGRHIDDRIEIDNKLSVKSIGSISVDWKSKFSRQNTSHLNRGEDDYRDSEFLWDNGLGMKWTRNKFNINLDFGFDLLEQQYHRSLIQGNRFHLNALGKIQKGGLNDLLFSASLIKSQFDTPDEEDNNDRDEIRYIFKLSTKRNVWHNYILNIGLDVDLNHLVYIFRQRSSENRWIRLLRLTSGISWEESHMSNSIYYSVVSNYTDYDYPPAESELSRVYRYFGLDDTLKIRLSSRFLLEADVSLIVDDHGRLDWSEWIEDVSEEGYGIGGKLQPTWRGRDGEASVGWSFYQRYSWIHQTQGEKIRGESIRSHGPVARIETVEYHGVSLMLTGSYLIIEDATRGSYRQPDVTLGMSWRG